MNCVELRESLAVVDDGTGVEQRAHLRLCRECSALVAELNSIAYAAVELRAADEPDPRVWKSIEASLRREGLIRPQRTSRSLLPSFGSPWGMARWLVPAAAALLIVIGLYVRPHARQDVASNPPAPVVSVNGPELALVGLNDDDLMQEVDQQNSGHERAVRRESAPGKPVHPGRENCGRRRTERRGSSSIAHGGVSGKSNAFRVGIGSFSAIMGRFFGVGRIRLHS